MRMGIPPEKANHKVWRLPLHCHVMLHVYMACMRLYCTVCSLAHYCCVALTLCAHEANHVHIEHHDMQRYSWMEPERVYMTLFASCRAV